MDNGKDTKEANKTALNINNELMSAFSGQDNIITIPRIYIKLTGSYQKAYILNQCVFYTNKSSLSNGWFWKTYDEWHEETDIPIRTLRRIFSEMTEIGLIEKRIKKIKGAPTLIIRPSMSNISNQIESMMMDSAKVADSIRPKWPNPFGQSGRILSLYTEDTNKENIGHFQDSAENSAESAEIEIPSVASETPPFGDSSNTPTEKKSSSKQSDYRKDERFMRFYNVYPRKEKPQDAYKAFRAVIGDDDDLLVRIIGDVGDRIKNHTQWSEKRFIPQPSRYLRSNDFESDVINDRIEQKESKKQVEEENMKRLSNMERISNEDRLREIAKHAEYNANGRAFREIKKAVNIPDGLSQLKKTLGLKK